jgi:putative membrane protein
MTRYALIALAALIGSSASAAAANRLDQKFIDNAIQGTLAEIRMGQLAQQKGQSEDVKSYGQILVADHTATNDQAEKVADQIGVTPPTEPSAKQNAMYDKMSKLTGAEFDRTFARAMVADHKKDIAEYKRESERKMMPLPI